MTYNDIKKPARVWNCSALYDCCSCGDNNCGCGYCFDCNACDNCKADNDAECENIVKIELA